MDAEVIEAFQCQVPPFLGRPHAWTYRNRPNGTYLCSNCLASLSKAELKRLTDNA